MNNTTIPRPEYPRPRLVRPDWLCLNGEWEFAFDDADAGRGDGWSDGRPLEQRITVPFAYQAPLSGVNDQSIHEVVWYARDLNVPPDWRGGERDVLLHFGAVDYRCTVWVNGQEVGHNRGGHVPFSFDITPYLKDGGNRLTLRVEDTQSTGQPRGKQAVSGMPRGIDYYCTTGIWQTVWLEPVTSMRIEDLQITPIVGDDPADDALDITVYLHAPATGWGLDVEVLEDGRVVGQAHEEDAGAGRVCACRSPTASAGRRSRLTCMTFGFAYVAASACWTKSPRMRGCEARGSMEDGSCSTASRRSSRWPWTRATGPTAA